MNRYAALGELPEDYPEQQQHMPARAVAAQFAQAAIIARQGNFFAVSSVATVASQEILQANPRRVYLFIQNLADPANPASDSITVNYSNPAGPVSTNIPPGGSYSYPVAPTNSINIASVSGSQPFVVEEASMRIEGLE